MFKKLHKDNYLLYAIKYYKSNLTWTSFSKDIKMFPKVSRYIMSRKNGPDNKQYINARHILNVIIYLSNSYDTEPLARLLFYICSDDSYSAIKTFLHFINKCPVYVPDIDIDKIQIDYNILNELQSL